MSALNSIQIHNKMQCYASFAGVYAADTLPHDITLPCGLIVNTDVTGLPGTHWLAIYVDKKKQGEYFDSYGLPPMVQHHLSFLRRHCTSWRHNTKTIQSPTSEMCGQYCMLYLDQKFKKKPLNQIIERMRAGSVDSNDAKAYVTFVNTFGHVTHNNRQGRCQSCCCRAAAAAIKVGARITPHQSPICRRHGRFTAARSRLRSQRSKKQAGVRGSRRRL